MCFINFKPENPRVTRLVMGGRHKTWKPLPGHATDIAAASHTNEVPAASNKFSSAYVSFMDTGMEMAGARAFPTICTAQPEFK